MGGSGKRLKNKAQGKRASTLAFFNMPENRAKYARLVTASKLIGGPTGSATRDSDGVSKPTSTSSSSDSARGSLQPGDSSAAKSTTSAAVQQRGASVLRGVHQQFEHRFPKKQVDERPNQSRTTQSGPAENVVAYYDRGREVDHFGNPRDPSEAPDQNMSSGFELDDDSISGFSEDDDLDLEQLVRVESRLDNTAALQSDVALLDDISIPILKNLSPLHISKLMTFASSVLEFAVNENQDEIFTSSYTVLLTTINEVIQPMCEGSHEDATVLIQGALDQLSFAYGGANRDLLGLVRTLEKLRGRPDAAQHQCRYKC